MKHKLPLALVCLFSLLLFGCTITQNVIPASNDVQIDTLYVIKNDQLHMEGLTPALVKLIESHGIDVKLVASRTDVPAGKCYLTYTANWAWDMAMYLVYFRAELMRDGSILGYAEYDARMGGGNMSKFGHTEDKIAPLVAQLFARVNTKPAAE